MTQGYLQPSKSELALSKAVEQARGCVATNIGLFDMIAWNGKQVGALLQAHFCDDEDQVSKIHYRSCSQCSHTRITMPLE